MKAKTTESGLAKFIRGLGKCLRVISLGKYETKLYHEGESYYSTSFGGIFTIFLLVVFCTISGQILMSCLNKEEWIFTEEVIYIDEWEHFNKTYGQLVDMGLSFPSYEFNVTSRDDVNTMEFRNEWDSVTDGIYSSYYSFVSIDLTTLGFYNFANPAGFSGYMRILPNLTQEMAIKVSTQPSRVVRYNKDSNTSAPVLLSTTVNG